MKPWNIDTRDRKPELKHDFVIGPPRSTYLSSKPARLYYCRRCQWSFLVCGSKVAVLDEVGRALLGEENLLGFETFEAGPCPVLESFVSAALSNPLSRPQSRRKAEETDGLAVWGFSAQSSRPRPVLRVLSGLRENLRGNS